MEKVKENALTDYIEMIQKSWTYAKLTKDEKESFDLAFHDIRVTNALKGSYRQRWDMLNALYSNFLYGVGYRNTGFWREEA